MNVSFGIMDPLKEKIRKKKDKNRRLSERALQVLDGMIPEIFED